MEMRDGQIAELHNVCKVGESWFHTPAPPTSCFVDGKQASREAAVEAAAKLISAARLPLVCGLVDQSTETQRAAIELAKKSNAVIDWTSGRAAAASLLAWQQVGNVSCSFGEIRQRADLVITWFCDPVRTHPRFIERFVDRYIAVDQTKTNTTEGAEKSIRVDSSTANRLCRQLRRHFYNVDTANKIANVESPEDAFLELASRIQSSQYCVFVCDDSLASRCGEASVVSLSKLVRLINDFTHCRLLVLHAHANALGIENSLSWTTGFPFAVGFRNGEPIFRPDEFTVEHLISHRLADLVICFGDPQQLPDRVLNHPNFREVNKIVFDDTSVESPMIDNVRFPVAKFGVGQSGTGFRSDGVPVKPVAHLESVDRPCDWWVKQIIKSIDSCH